MHQRLCFSVVVDGHGEIDVASEANFRPDRNGQPSHQGELLTLSSNIPGCGRKR
jgi:hypothetical protein